MAWRGVIIQLACLAALVFIIHGSHDPNVLWAAIGIVGTVLGQTVARARVSGPLETVTNGNGAGGPLSKGPGVAGPLVTLAFVGGAYAMHVLRWF
jgi:uncharacterized membrane protein YjfL (UPF0719 family)